MGKQKPYLNNEIIPIFILVNRFVVGVVSKLKVHHFNVKMKLNMCFDHRAQDVWDRLKYVGIIFSLNSNSVVYSLLEWNLSQKGKEQFPLKIPFE